MEATVFPWVGVGTGAASGAWEPAATHNVAVRVHACSRPGERGVVPGGDAVVIAVEWFAAMAEFKRWRLLVRRVARYVWQRCRSGRDVVGEDLRSWIAFSAGW